MDDLISRQAAIDTCMKYNGYGSVWACIMGDIKRLPSAQPEVKPISYMDCANAMLKMWMDKVVTDGEYNRIMDKANKHESERRTDE